MKKFFAFACVSSVFAVLLTGCGGQPQVSTPEQVQTAKSSQAQQDAANKQQAQGTGHNPGTTGGKP